MDDGRARPLRVLLVEDEAANRALIRAIFARIRDADVGPVELRDAPTLAAARSLIGADAFDVVLLDVRLPDGNGLDLATELAAQRAGDRPAIVILSASVLAVERTAALATGADAFLPKPFDARDLVEVLRTFSPG